MNKLMVIVLTLVMAIGFGAGSASAANSLRQGALGFNVDVNDDFILTGKFFITRDVAVLAGFGLGLRGGDNSGTDIGLGGGIRKYLKDEDFAPFVGATIFYSSAQGGDQKSFSLMGEGGAEYFLARQFSIEGKVGFGYRSETTTTPGPGSTTVKTTDFGTQRAGISFNYYF
jgi:hypothetical protein